MKRLLVIFFLFALVFQTQAQNSVFVLVDVSKSVTQNELNDAKQALFEVLSGAPLTKAFPFSQGKQQDMSGFKLSPGDKLTISRFGSLQTTLAINPNLVSIQNIPADINPVINSISWVPTDGQTYITLAKAKIAEFAKNHQITNYKLYIISDNINDDYGPGGKPNYPDDYTRNLAEGYHTPSNPVDESDYTKIKFASNSFFSLSFSPNVDITKYIPPNGNNNVIPPPIDTASQTPAIFLTTLADGKKDYPKPTDKNSFTISWKCDNCPEGTVYNVTLNQTDGGAFRDAKKNLISNSVSFSDLPSGVFRIVVSAPNAGSAATFVQTPSNTFGWIIFLMVVLLATGIGYYFWNKERNKKTDVFASGKSSSIFSGKNNSGGQSGNSSSGSDYF